MRFQHINRTRGRVFVAAIRRDFARAGVLIRRRWRVRLPATVSVVFAGPAESRSLKRRFLKQDRAANVLSFRYNGDGEIILTPAVIRREARRGGVRYPIRLRRMAVHGLLHIAGQHHEPSAAAARRFERREAELLRHLGLADDAVPR